MKAPRNIVQYRVKESHPVQDQKRRERNQIIIGKPLVHAYCAVLNFIQNDKNIENIVRENVHLKIGTIATSPCVSKKSAIIGSANQAKCGSGNAKRAANGSVQDNLTRFCAKRKYVD